MFSNIISLLATAFDSVYGWFVSIMQSTGSIGYLLGSIFAMLAIRFIIYPFLKGGVGASDPARRMNQKGADK